MADDDRDARQTFIRMLESLGYRVLAASNGPLAIEMIEKNSDIELLMLDIAMPEMNGIEVARVVLSKRPELPVVFMTGYIGSTKLEGAEQKRLMKKPFTVAELTKQVEDALACNLKGSTLCRCARHRAVEWAGCPSALGVIQVAASTNQLPKSCLYLRWPKWLCRDFPPLGKFRSHSDVAKS